MPSNDPRFSRLHTDPRFRRPKQKALKVEIDDRFKDVLQSEEFGGRGSKSKGKGKGVDKRGRALTGSHHSDQLKRFYRLRSASPEDEEGGSEFVDYARGEGVLDSSGSEDEDDDDDGQSDGSTDEEEELELGGKPKRGKIPELDIEDGDGESESEESHLDIDLSDEDRADEGTNDEEDEDEEVYAEPTKRIAAVNLDWDNLRAADLFSVFNSFLLPALRGAGGSKAGAGSSSSSSTSLGKLLHVRIYPSEFGKERMAREEVEGPSAGIFGAKFGARPGHEAEVDEYSSGDGIDEDEDEAQDEGEEDEDEDEDEDEEGDEDEDDDAEEGGEDEDESDDEEVGSRPISKRKGKGRASKEIDGLEIMSDVSDNEEGDVNMDKLRQYQLERLRYYYAVATFSTVQAAMKVVEECNGTEFERTANVLDLSYVPDEMDFADDDIKDEATEELKGYKGNDFVTDALRHSKVKLTWDQDDPNRIKVTRRNLTKEEMEEEDFKALVGSSDSEEEDVVPNGADGATVGSKRDKRDKDKLRGLLLNGDNDVGDVWGKAAWGSKYKDIDAGAKPSAGDMEITFRPALSTKPQANSEEMTTLEKYQLRVKERKQRKKEKVELKRSSGQGDKEEGEKDLGETDDFFGSASDEDEDEDDKEQQRRRKGTKADSAEVNDEDVEADEGLNEVVGGGHHVEHFSMKDILRAEKDQLSKKKRKRSKKKNADKERDVELGVDGWKIDTSDPRFKALHEEPDFAIDPSNPRFQKTKAMSELLSERNRRKQEGSGSSDQKPSQNGAVASGGKPKSELDSLVQSVKSKMGQNRGRKRVKRQA
ncbi:hypothetical protein BD324DRAFT_627244 [Kockovaella imperatae]|uniref:Uncharacterized protein n=1 Tax=Kockovaella imperatae TaxID=4999 RepID=A0A1Y1UFJ2_9TREE|nr:hypothetical protein BD324DRAFT_627244 [Kockovaella imperatae]ORX36813.1 hypothetical protein BD324DRAFT_627244 [Kockovaella imperatae]